MKISSTSVPQLQAARNAAATAAPEAPQPAPDAVVLNSKPEGPSRARTIAVTVGAVAIAGITSGLAFSGNGTASGVAGFFVGAGIGAYAAGTGTSKAMGKPMGGGTGTGLAIGACIAVAGIAGAIGGGIGGAILSAHHGNPLVGLAVGTVAAVATGTAIYRVDHKS